MTDIRDAPRIEADGGRDDSGLQIDKTVFGVAAALSVAFVLVGAIWPEDMASTTNEVLSWITTNFGWLFVLTSVGFVVFSAYLAFTRYGNIKLGPDDSEPEFSTFSWVSMMFATGMGIGLMFWGVAEPLTHLNAPPMDKAEAGTPEAARLAMQYAFFHWGFHPWAMYAVIGLSIGYFAYRKGYGNLVSATFRPADRRPGRADAGQGHRRDRDLRDAVRFGHLARPRRAADHRRHRQRLRPGRRQQDAGRGGHRGADRLLRGVGGVGRGEGHQVPLQRQRRRGGGAGPLPLRGRADGVHPRHVHRVHGRLPHPAARHELRDRRLRRAGLAERLDDLLLGLVDQLDPLRRHVHRAHLQGPHDPPVRGLRGADPEPGVVRLVRDPRRHGHQPPAQRGLEPAVDGDRVASPWSRRSSTPCGSSRWPA